MSQTPKHLKKVRFLLKTAKILPLSSYKKINIFGTLQGKQLKCQA